MSAKSNSHQRMLDGARNYANADKSDPFAYSRATAHLKCGVASPSADKGQAAFYDAEPYEGVRKVYRDGVEIGEVKATLYRGMVRP